MERAVIINFSDAINNEAIKERVDALWQTFCEQSFATNNREVIFSLKQMRLYHYQNKKPGKKIPLCLVFSTLNSPDILDLMPENSFIYFLLESNFDVFLIDWGSATQQNAHETFDDYITFYLDIVVRFIVEAYQYKKINLLGICQGGLLSLCYASVSSYVQQLILISTPIHFHTRQHMLRSLLMHIDLKHSDGIVPGFFLTQFFFSLRPFALLKKKLDYMISHWQDEHAMQTFFRIEKWLQHAPNQPQKALAQFIKNFYQQNKLIKNTLQIQEKKIELQKLQIPILNIAATDDHIVPPNASLLLKKYLATDYTAIKIKGGHLGFYINASLSERVTTLISQWFAKTNT